MRYFTALIVSLAAAFTQVAAAQDIPARVGRLAYTEGPVSVYQDPELGWDKAYVNTPVTSENSVWTDRGARAELRVGAIAVRQDELTQVDVARLDEDDFDAFLPRGAASIRVRYKERGDHITFSTPHALFMIEADGRYRLDVDEDRGETRFTVFAGHAFMESSSGRIPVEPGRVVFVSEDGRYGSERARADRFDQWADARDRQWQDTNARRYVSSDMTGYEELDRYGTWSQDTDYGAVWYPTQVASGWAPYRYGHWSHVRPWGWTWIDDQPWGYAPSHYGRWVQVNNRWAWAPGYRERQVWAPALVGFFGGAAFSVSVSSGAPVGWYPLAPWERYDPWYRTNTAYVTRVNRYVVDRRPSWYRGSGDQWRHWNRDRATTVVNRDVFVNRRAVQGSMVRVSPETIQRAAPTVSNTQVVQQVLPQRNEVIRYTQQNTATVAAPRTMMRASRENAAARQNGQVTAQPRAQAQAQAQAQAGQVVRPEFRRRGAAPQPSPASATAPATAQQPQNPAARVERAQQRQAEDAARTQAQQQEAQQREAERNAARAQREQLQSEQNRNERAQQRQAEEAARAHAQQGEAQQREAARAAREKQEREAQQRDSQQRAQQEQSQRAAREAQQQQERAQRAQQEQSQRAAREAQQQQERAQRAQQEQAQRAAKEAQQQQERAAKEAQQQQAQQADLQRRRQEAAQRAAQDTQRREEAYRQQQQQQAQQQQQRQQAAPKPQAEPKPQPEQKQQANPAARGESRGKEKDKDDKDKEKDKDKK